MTTTRIEHDAFGDIEVPASALWGAQTQRSLLHFRISTERMPEALLMALARVKRVAARVNGELGLLEAPLAEAIARAADEVLAGAHPGEFPLSVWQTGSGTQTNMNMNEVLANRASELLGGGRGESRRVHPNDHVNLGQSSNDVIPTAMHVAAVTVIVHDLLPALRGLRRTLARQVGGLCRHREDRPHPPAGRHAADAGAGSLGLGGAARSGRAGDREPDWRRCTSWPSAAPRWAPGSTRTRSSARASRPGWRPTPACRSAAHRTASRRSPRTTRWCTRTAR